jgi:hypothetical protein
MKLIHHANDSYTDLATNGPAITDPDVIAAAIEAGDVTEFENTVFATEKAARQANALIIPQIEALEMKAARPAIKITQLQANGGTQAEIDAETVFLNDVLEAIESLREQLI